MLALIGAIEDTGISRWLRESDSLFGFYFILTFHTIGLALVVGPNSIINLRILGVGRAIPLAPMKQWFVLMWFGLGLNIATGLLMLLAYPVKNLTNPDFYVKLVLVGVAVSVLAQIQVRAFGDASASEAVLEARTRRLAVSSLLLWVAVIATGRLLAYTCTYLMYEIPCRAT